MTKEPETRQAASKGKKGKGSTKKQPTKEEQSKTAPSRTRRKNATRDDEHEENVEEVPLVAKQQPSTSTKGKGGKKPAPAKKGRARSSPKGVSDAQWIAWLSEISLAQDWMSMLDAVGRIVEKIPSLPDSLFNDKMCYDLRDDQTLTLMPQDLQDMRQAWPVATLPDGSCLLHAMSRLVYGHPENHVEMRVRLICEAVSNEDHYMNAAYLQRSLLFDPNWGLGENILQAYVTFSGFLGRRNPADELVQLEVFHLEVIQSRAHGLYCPLWFIHVASNVLLRPIRSVYPQVDPTLGMVRALHNRTFEPWNLSDRDRLPICLMWTKPSPDSRQYSHIVPIVE